MTEETMKKELNVAEVLDRVKDLDNYNKRNLFTGRGYTLYYVTDEVLFTVVRKTVLETWQQAQYGRNH